MEPLIYFIEKKKKRLSIVILSDEQLYILSSKYLCPPIYGEMEY